MRIIKSGDIEIPIRASALALLYFRQEFDAEIMQETFVLISKLAAVQNMMNGKAPEHDLGSLDLEQIDLSAFDWKSITAPSVELYRLCWAMAKAQAEADGKTIEGFMEWIKKTEGAEGNLKVRDIQVGVITEAVEGFFR